MNTLLYCDIYILEFSKITQKKSYTKNDIPEKVLITAWYGSVTKDSVYTG